MSMWRAGLVTTALISLFLAGCATRGDETVEAKHTPGVPTQFTGSVVDYGLGEGPIICAGNVATSDPPQCGGYSLIGWDWELIEHDEFPPPNGDDSQAVTARSGDYSFEGEFNENGQIEVVPDSIEAVDSLVPSS